ncbi:MAG: addiction module toxin, HicA family [Rhodocyclaceae bacterium]|nr:MAG: addiction module toxin, HicA family [Rhodocyclaceae bacterium]
MKVSDLLQLPEKDGWFVVRQRGSHRPLHHSTKPGTVTVAGNASVDVPPGTLNTPLISRSIFFVVNQPTFLQ